MGNLLSPEKKQKRCRGGDASIKKCPYSDSLSKGTQTVSGVSLSDPSSLMITDWIDGLNDGLKLTPCTTQEPQN
jgi:hypothetical protein